MLCDLRLQNDLAEKRKNVKFIKENCDDIDLALWSEYMVKEGKQRVPTLSCFTILICFYFFQITTKIEKDKHFMEGWPRYGHQTGGQRNMISQSNLLYFKNLQFIIWLVPYVGKI